MNTAILAGIQLKQNKNEFQAAMEECANLCDACGIRVIGTITQQAQNLDKKTAFRSGKLEELAAQVKALDAEGVVFYNRLSLYEQERISEACGVDVIDRTTLILDIFSKRARSRQAKIQTEMARLEYNLPKILAEATAEDQQRGGAFTNRGAGEKRSVITERRYKAHITDLKNELKQMDLQAVQRRQKRAKSAVRSAALVGYTNAGKSSLMNLLLKQSGKDRKQVMEKDMLFATLDTSVRSIEFSGREFLLYDTVGFVSDLPHELVEAFKSTLDAARDADLLVEVIDAHDPSWQQKARVTEETLKQIGADDIPVLRVFNKMDLVKDPRACAGLKLSCRTGEGAEELCQEILQRLYPDEETLQCRLPYEQMSLLDSYRRILNIRIRKQDEQGMLLEVRGPKESAEVFRRFEVKEENE
jgi:GTP-binding protein HflX